MAATHTHIPSAVHKPQQNLNTVHEQKPFALQCYVQRASVSTKPSDELRFGQHRCFEMAPKMCVCCVMVWAQKVFSFESCSNLAQLFALLSRFPFFPVPPRSPFPFYVGEHVDTISQA